MPSFHKHLKRSFPFGICMWEGPCVLCFKRNGPRDALIMMSLCYKKLSRFVIAFFLRSKHLLISWLQSLPTVILKPKKIKSVTFHFLPIYLPWNDGTGCHDFSFMNAEVQASFFTLLFHSPSSRDFLSPFLFLRLGWYHLHIWGC